MSDLEKQVKDAFRAVHAEPSLNVSTLDYVCRKRRKRSLRPWTKALAAAACMLALFLGGYGTRMFLEPVSVISIDINPSIELGINAFDRVVTTQAFNPEGEQLLQSLDLRFQKWEKAVDAVMDSDTVRQLMDREETLTFTAVGQDEAESEALCRKVRDHTAGTGDCYSAGRQEVAQAHHSGLSYGKYLAYLEALEAGEDLTAEEAKQMTVKEIRHLSGHHSGHGSQSVTETTPPEETTFPTEETTVPTEPHHQGHGSSGKKHQKGHH